MIPESPKWLICSMDDKIKAKRWLIELREPGTDIDAEVGWEMMGYRIKPGAFVSPL
jgi:hypothetical protein